MLYRHVPVRSLRSSGAGLLTVAETRTERHGEPAFQNYGPAFGRTCRRVIATPNLSTFLKKCSQHRLYIWCILAFSRELDLPQVPYLGLDLITADNEGGTPNRALIFKNQPFIIVFWIFIFLFSACAFSFYLHAQHVVLQFCTKCAIQINMFRACFNSKHRANRIPEDTTMYFTE